ncbi:S-adenosyl-L-methionine-dependent methyltransferase [Paraphaeosphaeria sporulosa]|uniref:S-adenosyl-L-methionine-dependent methyltransferase n=1 Tax=Paraphaeosphaeria sporulosa TaxID=1460663 RepID=A0A177CZF3_9PLEO|nr:S-adenosyl-L-methionine-dependent methyltransferase [Paraphaeosphaeria sporulosa]OAG12317.1 S-adenosyl-L-methionine-dependent methyltransferase [Paraphaeosphaeria sporulosa]
MGGQKGEDVYNQSASFWDSYIKGRPSIPDSFFSTIFAYHASHSASFSHAHEVGAGVGVHSPRLAARFANVLVSDIIESNIQIAKARLQSLGCYTFKASSLEDTIDLPPASMDLVFASTMMHFTDVDKAVRAVHHQLKPGGTFAAGLYGTYALHEPEAQRVWQKLVQAICNNIIQRYGLDNRAKTILANEAAGLDSVGLPEEYFHPAQRIDYNFPQPSTLKDMILPPQYGLHPVSRIGRRDEVVRGVWDKGWFSSLGIDGLKGMADTWPHDEGDGEIVELWEELTGVVGEGEVEGAWMVSLLLATKK